MLLRHALLGAPVSDMQAGDGKRYWAGLAAAASRWYSS